jgi:predicted AAA+ superfamily ATPase
MIQRAIQDQILTSLNEFPVVGILGPRQVGKTTLAKDLKNKIAKKTIYLDLELTSDLNKLQDPELFLEQFDFKDTLIIIDEIQRKPELFPILRAVIDKNRNPGSFLILGSASRDLIMQSSESLAGRIIYHELAPFNVDETGSSKKNITTLWQRGGFPDSYLSNSDESSYRWRDAFIRTYLEMDIPQLGIRIPAPQLRSFWTMLAHNHGQLWNASQISKSLGITAPTVKHYLSILQETFIIRLLQPYHTNIKKRLIKSPKIYIRDSGLLHTLLLQKSIQQLQGHPIVGNSWEGFIIEQIFSILPFGWEVYFYRTSAGAEIDLILINPEDKPIAVEIKYSLAPKPEKGFSIAFDDLGCSAGYLIYPGEESYPIKKQVTALPSHQISQIFNK